MNTSYTVPLLTVNLNISTKWTVALKFYSKYTFHVDFINIVMGWIVSPQNSYVEALTTDVMVFGYKACGRFSLKKPYKWGLSMVSGPL